MECVGDSSGAQPQRRLSLGIVQKQLPIPAPLLPLPVRNERGEGRGEGWLYYLNYALNSGLIFALPLSEDHRFLPPDNGSRPTGWPPEAVAGRPPVPAFP